MQYKVWASKDAPATCTFTIFVKSIRFKSEAKIKLVRGKLNIMHSSLDFVSEITNDLRESRVNPEGSYTLTSLISAISLSQMNVSWHGKYENAGSSSEYAASKPSQNRSQFKTHISENNELDDIYQKTQELDISTIPFIHGTDELEIKVDSREPSIIQAIFFRSSIADVSVTSLEIGDILIRNKSTNDTLIIERKTTQDLEESTKSHHMHSQAERLHDYRCAISNSGSRCRVMWFVEAQDNAQRVFYNTLNHVRNVDGVVNYLSGILDQHVVHTYSPNHTAYLCIKMAQGFFEEQLYYSINAARTKSKRNKQAPQKHMAGVDHGVSLSSRNSEGLLSQIPGINRKVAKTISQSGLSISDLCRYSIDELCEIDGIGKKSAEKIREALHKS